MAEVVGCGDRNEGREEPGSYGCRLDAAAVQVEGDEADADMQGFSRDFVFMYKGFVVSVEGNEAQGRRRAGEFAPGLLQRGVGRKVTIRLWERAVRQRI